MARNYCDAKSQTAKHRSTFTINGNRKFKNHGDNKYKRKIKLGTLYKVSCF